MNKKQKNVLIRIIVAAILIALLKLLPIDGWLEFGLFLVPYFVIGHDILKKAWKGIRNRQAFDENFLMAVATIGAILLGEYDAVLSDRRIVPELCGGKEPKKHQ